MLPGADEKFENRTKQYRTPPLPVTLSERLLPGGRAKKLPQKVSSSALVVRRMVADDGTGKRRKTSKGLRVNKTVCKSC